MDPDLPISATHEVRDRCLCLHAQRAARRLGRVFDEALRPVGLTNGQFSLLMALNRPDGPRVGDLTGVLAMDRTTVTAALKPLERRGLVDSFADDQDARARRLRLTDAGREALKQALPIWREMHDRVDALLSRITPEALRTGLVEVLGEVDRPT
ncbi:MarR family winged helix-turn-helix transcriptional regulator [Sulfitobacter sp. D35]|uniref:MarR family winged helix-turn-helix transcriptional regulator n=1 Tax=Sulfitobacter sp. D35 TaxID=3083252 RepID=UPI00296EBE9F|nr:MarR family winged helix-turn-helix transcriptional regulator [Sulfitobacter sp. D35]MDW4497557.1 MarR family winged helix-turn-helix transcriptional regulator [Sulfitobacter sp. D35]